MSTTEAEAQNPHPRDVHENPYGPQPTLFDELGNDEVGAVQDSQAPTEELRVGQEQEIDSAGDSITETEQHTEAEQTVPEESSPDKLMAWVREHPAVSSIMGFLALGLVATGLRAVSDSKPAGERITIEQSDDSTVITVTPEAPVDASENELKDIEVEGKSTDEGYIETVFDPNTGIKTETLYTSPYASIETTILPDDSANEATPTYYESPDDVPIIPIDHAAWEHFTEKSYDTFVDEVTEMIPEISGRPYDGQDVLEGATQRRIKAFVDRDPRYYMTVSSPENHDYAMTHADIKASTEEYNALDEDGKAEWEQMYNAHVEDVKLDLVAHLETESGETRALTTDFNVSDALTWTGNYTNTTDGDSPYRRQAVFARTATELGEIFLITEDTQLDN